MNEEEIKKKAKEVYPEHEFGLYIKENELKREGYTKALTELEFIPKIKGWIARDEDGSVWFHYSKPQRKDEGRWESSICPQPMEIYNVPLPELTWEDEPVEIELILRKS